MPQGTKNGRGLPGEALAKIAVAGGEALLDAFLAPIIGDERMAVGIGAGYDDGILDVLEELAEAKRDLIEAAGDGQCLLGILIFP